MHPSAFTMLHFLFPAAALIFQAAAGPSCS
jgi:hypothetical protein